MNFDRFFFLHDEDYDEYDSEEEYLDAHKQDDSYHFSIPFEYIKKKHGDGDYDIGITNMEVDVVWDSSDHGYRISYYVPEMYLIDPAEGNSDEEGFYSIDVEPIVLDELDNLGIGAELII